MDKFKVGDVVEYVDDHIPHRGWYLYSLRKGNLCTIVVLRDGKITNEKNGEERLNANIVNLDISKIKKRG